MTHAITNTMNDDLYKFPRLYLSAPLNGGDIPLCDEHAHYIRNVLRKADGDCVRLFNGMDGEWLAQLFYEGKRGVIARTQKQVKQQPQRKRHVHL
ncbi:MAG: 16S rRNA (uracil(1498)-N(3))-methyltransferase, partial [Alphaproteobacteria bacterium]|nr:16S rRNA (uracil(1498)-N(3))-methyltransferase [Alphaproteobacteria bacterium]